MQDVQGFSEVVGRVLRQVRGARSLSLRQVTVRSSGRFKPSSIASYERGERQISLQRLFALAEVYDVAPERIVAAIAYHLEQRRTQTAGGVPGDLGDPLRVLDPWNDSRAGRADADPSPLRG